MEKCETKQIDGTYILSKRFIEHDMY